MGRMNESAWQLTQRTNPVLVAYDYQSLRRDQWKLFSVIKVLLIRGIQVVC